MNCFFCSVYIIESIKAFAFFSYIMMYKTSAAITMRQSGQLKSNFVAMTYD